MRIVFALLALAAANRALAHPSTVAHDHPHGPSLLPHLEFIVAGIVLAGVAAIAAGYLFKRR